MNLCDCGECTECLHVSRGRAFRELDETRKRLSEAESLLRENPWVRGCLAADFDGDELRCSMEGAGVCWKHRVRAFLRRSP